MNSRVLVLFLILLPCIYGQLNRASISGVVTDSQGAAVSGASVVATNTATDVATRPTTNEAGFYSIPNLQIGSYLLAVERQGFRRYEHKDITLNTGRGSVAKIRVVGSGIGRRPCRSPRRNRSRAANTRAR